MGLYNIRYKLERLIHRLNINISEQAMYIQQRWNDVICLVGYDIIILANTI